MLNLLLKWVAYALGIVFVAWVVPGITVENFLAAMFVCVIIALINTFVKPLLQVISFPITVLTLGLFALVLNALLLMLAGYLAPGFQVDGFMSALIGSIILSLLSVLINRIGNKEEV
ncbi:MAG: phage holin family protein [Muribaculaceae bacterium]|nr:phage holin family protein [Muribaculaceae bacterium]